MKNTKHKKQSSLRGKNAKDTFCNKGCDRGDTWKKHIKILFFCLILLLIPFVSSERIYQANQSLDLKVPCENNGTYCSGVATCNLTLIYPNETVAVNNKRMTNQVSYFNYTLSNEMTNVLNQDYSTIVMCIDGSEKGHSTFNIKFTLNGKEPVGDNFLIFFYVVFIIISVVLIFFLVMNIAKLASLSTTIGDVALSWGFYIILIIMSWLGNLYIPEQSFNIFITNLWLTTASAFVFGILPLIGLVLTMIKKSTDKGNVPSIQELTGRYF